MRTVSEVFAFLNEEGGEAVIPVAPHTKIYRVTDQVAALRFYDTFIAYYGPNAVKLDVAGWHTRTTWKRLMDFTPASGFGKTFLRYIEQPNGDSVLYEPGITLDYDGMVLNPMWPSRQSAIESTVNNTIELCRDYADRATRAWDTNSEAACDSCDVGDGSPEHLWAHVHADYGPTLPNEWDGRADRLMAQGWHTDAMVERIRKDFTRSLLNELLPYGLQLEAPDYQFSMSNTPM